VAKQLGQSGAWSSVENDRLFLEGVVLSSDGKEKIKAAASGSIGDAEEIGRQVADDLIVSGAKKYLET